MTELARVLEHVLAVAAAQAPSKRARGEDLGTVANQLEGAAADVATGVLTVMGRAELAGHLEDRISARIQLRIALIGHVMSIVNPGDGEINYELGLPDTAWVRDMRGSTGAALRKNRQYHAHCDGQSTPSPEPEDADSPWANAARTLLDNTAFTLALDIGAGCDLDAIRDRLAELAAVPGCPANLAPLPPRRHP